MGGPFSSSIVNYAKPCVIKTLKLPISRLAVTQNHSFTRRCLQYVFIAEKFPQVIRPISEIAGMMTGKLINLHVAASPGEHEAGLEGCGVHLSSERAFGAKRTGTVRIGIFVPNHLLLADRLAFTRPQLSVEVVYTKQAILGSRTRKSFGRRGGSLKSSL